MLKAAYFDADGTLVSFRTHEMPEDAREGLRRLGAAGVKRILCTGRNVRSSAALIETGLFDGFAFLNGQLCQLDGEIVRDAPVDPSDLEIAMAGAEAGEFTLEFIGRDGSFLNRLDDYTYRNNTSRRAAPMRVRPVREALELTVYLFHLYGPAGSEEPLVRRAKNLTAARWAKNFADVYPADGGKAAGMRAINAALGIAREETIAFGDGENDIPMLRYAGIGVAMGGSDLSVRAAADYVTPSVDEGGILQAVGYFMEKSGM